MSSEISIQEALKIDSNSNLKKTALEPIKCYGIIESFKIGEF